MRSLPQALPLSKGDLKSFSSRIGSPAGYTTIAKFLKDINFAVEVLFHDLHIFRDFDDAPVPPRQAASKQPPPPPQPAFAASFGDGGGDDEDFDDADFGDFDDSPRLSKPPAIASPFTAAITGFGPCRISPNV